MALQQRWWAIAAMACVLAGCGGVQGDDGGFEVQVQNDSTVTSMNLTDVGLSIASGLPDPTRVYKTDSLSGNLLWTANTPGSTNYQLHISVSAHEGEKGGNGLLPYVDGLNLPLEATKGKKGDTRHLSAIFVGGNFIVVKNSVTIAGAAF